MIPWTNFDNASYNDAPDDGGLRISEFLLEYIDHGPSMTFLYFESPMLEVAHERQFVIAQQGGDSSGFEAAHTRRMEECLTQLADHFQHFANDDLCQPSSPCGSDLLYCWAPDILLDTVPPLVMFEGQAENTARLECGQPDALPITTPSSTNPLTETVPAVTPDVDMDADDLSTEAKQNLMRRISRLRAGTTLPIHATRAQRRVRQRKRLDTKPVMEHAPVRKKRNSQCVIDEHEEQANIVMRHFATSSLKRSHDDHINNNIHAKIRSKGT